MKPSSSPLCVASAHPTADVTAVGQPFTPSRLTLGTVQFGLRYGVANRTGRPSFASVCALLEQAAADGVNTLDTAASYGQSEAVLGEALAQTGLRGHYQVVSKVEPLAEGLSGSEAIRLIEASVVRSLRDLKLDYLPACLFHRENNICYADGLLRLKERGLIGAAGVSIVSPEGAATALAQQGLAVWQVPSNVLDRRYTGSGLAAAAKASGVMLFARSIYLQGLLLLDDEATPPALVEVCGPRRQLRLLAEASGMELAELLFRAMLGCGAIASLVVGVETAAQLDINLAYLKRGSLPADVATALEGLGLRVSDMLVNPPLWPK